MTYFNDKGKKRLNYLGIFLGLRERNLTLILALKLLQICAIFILFLFEIGDVIGALLQLLVNVFDSLGHILLALL